MLLFFSALHILAHTHTTQRSTWQTVIDVAQIVSPIMTLVTGLIALYISFSGDRKLDRTSRARAKIILAKFASSILAAKALCEKAIEQLDKDENIDISELLDKAPISELIELKIDISDEQVQTLIHLNEIGALALITSMRAMLSINNSATRLQLYRQHLRTESGRLRLIIDVKTLQAHLSLCNMQLSTVVAFLPVNRIFAVP